MTGIENTAPRTRNAAATRATILEAARRRFAREGYDGASLRDIASEARVDVALVSRYFGCKEELFNEVLTSEGPPDDLLRGDRADFGRRVARILVNEPRDDAKLERLLMILRSASSPKASAAVRSNMQETFYGPLEELLGGEDRVVRSRLVGSIITGFAITRAIDETYLLDSTCCAELSERFASLLQDIVDAPPKGR